MAIKDYITDIKNIISAGQLNDESISEITTKLASLQSQADLVLKKQELANNEAKLNRQKYQKLSAQYTDLSYVKSQLEVAKSELSKLNEYRTGIVNDKKERSNRIAKLFQLKLEDKTSKDYAKYNTVFDSFDFNTEDQSAYDKNIKMYELYDKIQYFGTDRIRDFTPLKPPKSKQPSKPTDNWRDKIGLK